MALDVTLTWPPGSPLAQKPRLEYSRCPDGDCTDARETLVTVEAPSPLRAGPAPLGFAANDPLLLSVWVPQNGAQRRSPPSGPPEVPPAGNATAEVAALAAPESPSPTASGT